MASPENIPLPADKQQVGEKYAEKFFALYQQGKITFAELLQGLGQPEVTKEAAQGDAAFLHYKEEKEEYKRDPWKHDMRQSCKRFVAISGDEPKDSTALTERYQVEFQDSIKEKRLSALEAMVITLLMYSSSTLGGINFLFALLLRVPEEDRLGLFNHLVLSYHSPEKQAVLGRRVQYLTCPLLPEGVNDMFNANMSAKAERLAKPIKGGATDGFEEFATPYRQYKKISMAVVFWQFTTLRVHKPMSSTLAVSRRSLVPHMTR